MSEQTRAALHDAIDAHIRDEFPEKHDGEHLTAWAAVAAYEDLNDPEVASYGIVGSGRAHTSLGLLGMGETLLVNPD